MVLDNFNADEFNARNESSVEFWELVDNIILWICINKKEGYLESYIIVAFFNQYDVQILFYILFKFTRSRSV